jgi:hypothetical protein
MTSKGHVGAGNQRVGVEFPLDKEGEATRIDPFGEELVGVRSGGAC